MYEKLLEAEKLYLKRLKKFFHYDFIRLGEINYNVDDPPSVHTSSGFNLKIAYTSSQKEHISRTLKLNGDSKSGLATILRFWTQVNAFFREVKESVVLWL
jgi:hypothetical protein